MRIKDFKNYLPFKKHKQIARIFEQLLKKISFKDHSFLQTALILVNITGHSFIQRMSSIS